MSFYLYAMCDGPRVGLCPPARGLAAGVHRVRGQEAETQAHEAGADRHQGGGGHRPSARPGAPGQVH